MPIIVTATVKNKPDTDNTETGLTQDVSVAFSL
jgi:hypothetical protein